MEMTVKDFSKRVVAYRHLRARRPPSIRVGQANSPPIVYYLCPDLDRPSGGVRVIYRHVDILNAAGVPASVLHHRRNFRCTWFQHSTPVAWANEIELTAADTMVVPEVYGPHFDSIPSGPRLIVFNQNGYLTFDRVPRGQHLSYARFDAALTVSDDSAEYLRFAFPGLKVSVVTNVIDPTVFYPAEKPPGKQILMMPRKRPEDAEQVIRLLGHRLVGWTMRSLEHVSERDVAHAMRSSSIFLAFGHHEGFGLPPAEAMASGCYVIGFTGFGGREIFDPSSSIAIEDGNVLSFARAVGDAMDRFVISPDETRQAGLRAAAHVRSTFTVERQRDELLRFFAQMGS